MTTIKGTARTASSKQQYHSSRSIILILFWLFFMYSVCLISYRLGQQQSQSSLQNWDPDINIQPSSLTAPKTTAVPRALRIDESKLPYKCGVVFFYHIPSTGGSTIKTWLTKYNKIQFFEHWGRKKENEDVQQRYTVQDTFINGGGKSNKVGMNKYITNLQSNEWRIAHCHHSSMNLNITADVYLSKWRSIVEKQGCAFIGNVMFRDALSHALSLFKNMDRVDDGTTREEWIEHLYTKSDRGMWQTQLDYLLYNFLDRNPDGVDKDTKVQRALQILRNHFDIVTIGNHDLYKMKLLSMTGWSEIEMKRTNTFAGELSFTKKEVEEIQELLDSNGDIDFIYEVKKLYNKS